jgi:putative Holliday junction resolvase
MRILAIDPGDRRVGVAISDPTETLARPLEILTRSSWEADAAALRAIIDAHDVGLVVVGLPISLDGSIGPQARHIMVYAEELAGRLSVDVVQWDERYSSQEAEEILRRNRGRDYDPRMDIDAVAAAVILQDYLDCRQRDSGADDWNRELDQVGDESLEKGG